MMWFGCVVCWYLDDGVSIVVCVVWFFVVLIVLRFF